MKPAEQTTGEAQQPGELGLGSEIGPSALLDAVSKSFGRLRESEQKVARVVVAAPDWVIHATVADVARRSGVSEPTVMRFCTALGFSGFRSFQLLLAQGLALGVPATQSVITPADSVAQIVSKIFAYSVTSLDHARRVLRLEAIEAAVSALSSAHEILFLGLGTSGVVAQDAQQRFFLFDVPCSAPVDAHLQFMAASLAGPDTRVIAISHTGRTLGILDSVKAARANGAKIIAITGCENRLSELADIAIIVETLENTDFYTPTISRLAHLVIIDILATAVVVRRGPDKIEKLRRMKAQLAVFARGDSHTPPTDGRGQA